MTSKAISRSFLVLLLSLFTLMLSTAPASAQAPAKHYTFTVNTTADTHDAHPGDGKCADQNGNCSLRAATEEADALPSGSSITITVPSGTYGLTLGPLQFTANTITLTGASSKTTIITGNQTLELLSISSGSPVQLNRLTVNGNGGSGAGIVNNGTLTVSHSTITANNGGGISNGGALGVSHSTISGNSNTNGGAGIDNSSGTVTMSHSIITANNGVGISNINYGTVTMNNSTISDNSGGGIFTVGYHGGSTLTILNSTISGNSAPSGGGIYDTAGDVIVSNSTISGNSATSGDGGGIDFPNSDGGSVTVNNSTISGNSATGKGGNIANTNINGPVTLKGTIVANSTGAPNCTSMITDMGYNLDSGTSCRFRKKTDLNKTNPMLGPLGNHGGPTQTMALLQGSKAIDWVVLGGCSATDQRGHKRPDAHEQTCDIGAYESAY